MLKLNFKKTIGWSGFLLATSWSTAPASTEGFGGNAAGALLIHAYQMRHHAYHLLWAEKRSEQLTKALLYILVAYLLFDKKFFQKDTGVKGVIEVDVTKLINEKVNDWIGKMQNKTNITDPFFASLKQTVLNTYGTKESLLDKPNNNSSVLRQELKQEYDLQLKKKDLVIKDLTMANKKLTTENETLKKAVSIYAKACDYLFAVLGIDLAQDKSSMGYFSKNSITGSGGFLDAKKVKLSQKIRIRQTAAQAFAALGFGTDHTKLDIEQLEQLKEEVEKEALFKKNKALLGQRLLGKKELLQN